MSPCLATRAARWLDGWMAGWLLAGSLAGYLAAGWLPDWLAGWLACFIRAESVATLMVETLKNPDIFSP